MAELTFSVGFRDDDYIFFPACVYHGNRFPALQKKYPPMFTVDEAQIDMPLTVTEVPRLHPDGSGCIEVTTGDVSVPCIGVYAPSLGRGYLLFTVQQIGGRNLGLSYENGVMRITCPARRALVYTMMKLSPNEHPYAPLEADIPHRMLEFACGSLEEFFRVFFENRKIMGMDDTLPETISPEKQIRLHIEKYNRVNWRPNGEFYGVGDTDVKYSVWQAGWIGGAMSTYMLLKCGGPLEKERARKTLEHLFRYQGKSGLFYGGCDKDLVKFGDGFTEPGTENWTLIRKSADVLYFVLRQFPLLDSVPEHMKTGIRRCADAFVKLWRTYGQLGQFIDAETGAIAVGGSASGAMAPAGLLQAYRYFGDEEYLRCAREIARYYCTEFLERGVTTGGPGEILQCPDSESAFALLESLTELYGETKEEEFLHCARFAAHLCSSWVVPYNYRFPEDCEFGRLDMKTVGTVFANVQNKHSAPGICTLSGSSLLRLYEWTGDEAILRLYREITTTVPQYMSTAERPIRANNGTILPPGFINERVNMSDWEGQQNVGEVFYGSCWSEVSNMLHLADLWDEDASAR